MNAKEARKITDEVLMDDKGFNAILFNIKSAAQRGETSLIVYKEPKQVPYTRTRLVALGYLCGNVKTFQDRDGPEQSFIVNW
jgi:hypothetical protein